MKKVILVLFILISNLASSQEFKLEKGKIIDSIKVKNSLNESFTIYLPNSFDESKLSPIVFIFEPLARGKVGISPFIKAAERYGYILVCSNNSRNAPYEINFEIANRLFSHVFENFKVNSKRIYTAGFSGGSRLASAIAVLTEQIQGVIACGAGLSKNKSHLPYKDNFSYVGIVGDEDMNFKEMYNTKAFLDRLNISNELFVYEFNHRWPNQEQILKAFDWLELEAYRKKLISVNEENLKRIYLDDLEFARKYVKINKPIQVHNAYERAINGFSGYYNVDSIIELKQNLKRSKLYNKEYKILNNSFKKEVILSDKFIDKFNSDFSKTSVNLKWWRNEISSLKKDIASSKSTSNAKMLKRLEYKIFALAIETATLGNKIKNINQAIFCYDVCLMIYPKYYFLYFRQIENFLNKNDEKSALQYLQTLLNEGYTDLDKIKNHKAFRSLLNNERFLELLKI